MPNKPMKWYSNTEPFAPQTISEFKKIESELDSMRKSASEASDKLLKDEIENQIAVQRLVNAGKITHDEAERAKLIATRDRIEKELSLAKDQAARLARLPTPARVDGKSEQEADNLANKK